jgi:Protein of unknown function (DUF2867)
MNRWVKRLLATGLAVALLLIGLSNESVLTMTTAVRYTSGTGRVYFALVRPIHRPLMPFMVSRMAR